MTDAELEAAIVRAMLDGRGELADLLARRLKARLLERAGVPSIARRAE